MKTAGDVNQAVRGMAQLYRNEGDGEMIAFYTQILLSQLTPEQACSSIATWCASESRWPAPAMIIQLLKPKKETRDVAGDLMTDLMRLIGQKGYTWESTYRYDGYASLEEAIASECGEHALAVVARVGGWSRFCREWGGEEGDGTARAQLRGLCESQLKFPASADARPALPAPGTKQVDAVGEYIAIQKTLRARQAKEELQALCVEASDEAGK